MIGKSFFLPNYRNAEKYKKPILAEGLGILLISWAMVIGFTLRRFLYY